MQSGCPICFEQLIEKKYLSKNAIKKNIFIIKRTQSYFIFGEVASRLLKIDTKYWFFTLFQIIKLFAGQ